MVAELKVQFSLRNLLKATGLPKSVYYYYCESMQRPCPDESLKAQLQAIYHAHKGRYGYRRITLSLRLSGLLVNHKRVQRLMCELGLKSKVRPKRYRSYKGEVGRIASDLVQRSLRLAGRMKSG